MSLSLSFLFFLCSSKERTKERAPEMTTSAKTGARYTGLNGATVLAEVRTISGLPTRRHLLNTVPALIQFFSGAVAKPKKVRTEPKASSAKPT
jgi:hypothetical protein